MRNSIRWTLLVVGVAWMAFVYASFYLVQQQRPLVAANLAALVDDLLNLLTLGCLMVVGLGCGSGLCRRFGVRFSGLEERVLLGCGVGLGTISLLVLGIGLLGWLNRWMMLVLLLSLALVSLPESMAIVGHIRRRGALHLSTSGWSLYVSATALLTLLVAMTPPTDFDGLLYHLTMPRLYIEQGRIVPTMDNVPQFFPSLVEMLYTMAMLLKGDVVAKLIHFGYMLLTGGLVYLLTRRHVGTQYGWQAVVAYAAIPMVGVLGGWAYTDLALCFYQLAAFYALLNWSEKMEIPWLVLAAVLCGLAMGVKYTSFSCPLTLGALVVWRLAQSKAHWTECFRPLVTFGAVTVLIASPWYVKNWVFTGNPVYPFAFGLFGGKGWDWWRAAWYARAGSGLGWDWQELVKLPWTLTLGLKDINFYDGRSGPLFLLALPLLLSWTLRIWGRKSRPEAVTYLSLWAGVVYVTWMMGVVSSHSLFQSRQLLPALVALCPVLVYLLDDLREVDVPRLSLRRVVVMSVALVLAGNVCYQFLEAVRLRPLTVLVGEESREQFLRRILGAHYAAMELVNERVPEGGKVLFLWEPRTYYCQRVAQPDAVLEQWAWRVYRQGGDLSAIARSLGTEGYTHVLLHRAGLEFMRRTRLDPLSDADLEGWDTFAAGYLRSVATVGDAYELYSLSEEGLSGGQSR